MTSTDNTKTVLIIQFRPDWTRDHERECFRQWLAEEAPDYTPKFISYFDDKALLMRPAELVQQVDRVIFAGSAGLYLADGHDSDIVATSQDIVAHLNPIIDAVIMEAKPLLGICFGHQLIGAYFGGRVENDIEQAETGFVEVMLRVDPTSDVLLEGLPRQFVTVMGHQDSVTNLPPEAVILGHSERCGIEMVRYRHHLIWGIQFHPELTTEAFFHRLMQFPEYADYAASLQPVPTPYGRKVLNNFLRTPSATLQSTSR